jgi:hypothetical protein
MDSRGGVTVAASAPMRYRDVVGCAGVARRLAALLQQVQRGPAFGRAASFRGVQARWRLGGSAGRLLRQSRSAKMIYARRLAGNLKSPPVLFEPAAERPMKNIPASKEG